MSHTKSNAKSFRCTRQEDHFSINSQYLQRQRMLLYFMHFKIFEFQNSNRIKSYTRCMYIYTEWNILKAFIKKHKDFAVLPLFIFSVSHPTDGSVLFCLLKQLRIATALDYHFSYCINNPNIFPSN